MESWPTDTRISNGPVQKGKSKGKGKEKESHRAFYPALDHGAMAAVTLVEEHGRLEWKSAVNTSKEVNARHFVSGMHVKVFPSTRPPPLHIPHTTILQRAEQGANFLRTHLPDVDITAELMRDEITEDAKITRTLEEFDPYAGNLLETVVRQDSASKRGIFLAFPMGDLNCDLNISPFLVSKSDRTTFKPAAQPVRTFETPIQQIISSKPSTATKQSSFLAVRTFGSTSLFEMKPANPSRNSAHVQLHDIASITSSDVGKHSVVDMKLLPAPFRSVVVNSHGSVYTCTVDQGQKSIVPWASASPSNADTDNFWRVALNEDLNTCVLASGKTLQQLDFRSKSHSGELYTARYSGEMITSIQNDLEDHLTRLVSTSQILWIDRRFHKKPLLGYTHHRQYDRTLEATTISVLDSPLTFLTSRKNGLVTIYDVTLSSDSLVQVNYAPHCLSTVSQADGQPMGHTVFHHPLDTRDKEICLLALTGRGTVHRFDLVQSSIAPEEHNPSQDVHWSADVEALDLEAANLRPDVGTLGEQDKSEVDMFPVYDNIFRTHSERARLEEESNAEAAYEVIDQVPSFWQNSNVPVEHTLTAYDIIFRSGDEPGQSSRADFLTESILNSKRGYRALSQERITTEDTRKGAAWHRSIRPTLRVFDSTIAESDQLASITDVAEALRSFDLRDDPERSEQSVRQESEARELLALDLALASDVYSSQSFSNSSSNPRQYLSADHLEELETMTESLSINAEPPQVDFRYLRPIPKGSVDHYESEAQPEQEQGICPIGVRLLLKDWEVGTNPDKFTYIDPYDESQPQPIRHRKFSPPRVGPATQTHATAQSQPIGPPVVVPLGFTVPPAANGHAQRPPFVAQSQPSAVAQPMRMSNTQGAESNAAFSQDFMMSTQILPGPHGGRPMPSKKKPPKKRLGGF